MTVSVGLAQRCLTVETLAQKLAAAQSVTSGVHDWTSLATYKQTHRHSASEMSAVLLLHMYIEK